MEPNQEEVEKMAEITVKDFEDAMERSAGMRGLGLTQHERNEAAKACYGLALKMTAAAREKTVGMNIDWDAMFQNNTDCYADTTDESVVPAMTKERFLQVIKSVNHE